ncbi:ribose-phosphate diphosphokinase [Acidimicrobiaceae bacterium USS-CC1]|uniref:ribose-phosphate diphosphokinase n=1 Tax=Acidiferrimicrobium australe TaxID=2664430 RepID=A0ABW9QRB1_9ACTN|nr:ribose-phosphate diphosphokinase [Acidiferrimicrobium australe]
MGARVVAGTANRRLACAVTAALGTEPAVSETARFPDGELRPVVAELRGEDVYVVQPTGPPVNEHLVELLLLLDACRRAGAARVTAVVPYFGYARQDRRGKAGEAVGARVVADALAAVGADRLLVVDPHTIALEAVCSMPVEMLTAVPMVAAGLQPALPDAAVLVAPDLGAVKLAERYSSILQRPVAVVRKTRVSGEVVRAHQLVGDVSGRPVVIVDDMISTGSTIEVAAAVLRAHGAAAAPTAAATHGPLVRGAVERMAGAGVARCLVTDTAAGEDRGSVEVCSVAGLLADAIDRLHRDRALDDLLLHA